MFPKRPISSLLVPFLFSFVPYVFPFVLFCSLRVPLMFALGSLGWEGKVRRGGVRGNALVWVQIELQFSSLRIRSAAMAPLVENSHPKGLPNLVLLTERACGELQAAAVRHLRQAEAWMQQVGGGIVSRNPALGEFLQQVEGFKVGVRGNRASERLVLTRGRDFAAIIPGDSVAEMVISSSVFNFLNIYNTILIARLVLTWFPSAPEAIVNPLSTICDPYLNVFRGIIPPLGTLDLSPILAFTVLNVFTSTAQALPAELDSKPREKLGWRQLVQRRKGLKGPPLSKVRPISGMSASIEI
ncbi:hypothetical protein M758_1G247000 [Ceratodon purpureus]|nr:hypothetical protein M758_1G247000 [Ceratodon purpureus]